MPRSPMRRALPANSKVLAPLKCPITRRHFKAHARLLRIRIGSGDEGFTYYARPRIFTTGTFGWMINTNQKPNEKLVVMIGGVPCKVQMNVMLYVVGSKERKE